MRQFINPKYNSDDLVNFIQSLPLTFDNEGTYIFKGRNTIKSFYLKNDVKELSPLVVKRFKKPNIVQKIIYSFFKRSKAQRAYINGGKLINKKINTPINVAFLETWQNGLFKYGYYVTTTDNSTPIANELNVENFNKELATEFAKFAAELHIKGILHHDLNSTNVLYKKDDDGHYSFSLIDINRMSFINDKLNIEKKECFDNLTRFTGKIDLYKYVLQNYIKFRGWETNKDLSEAIKIKIHHDACWRRRKAFLSYFK